MDPSLRSGFQKKAECCVLLSHESSRPPLLDGANAFAMIFSLHEPALFGELVIGLGFDGSGEVSPQCHSGGTDGKGCAFRDIGSELSCRIAQALGSDQHISQTPGQGLLSMNAPRSQEHQT